MFKEYSCVAQKDCLFNVETIVFRVLEVLKLDTFGIIISVIKYDESA